MDSLALVEREQKLDRAIREMWDRAMPQCVGSDGTVWIDTQTAILQDYLCNWFVQALEIDCKLDASWGA